MTIDTWTLELWQIAALAGLVLLVLGVIVWAVVRRRGGRGRHLTERQRQAALTREHESLDERYALLSERVDRLDRAQQEMLTELSAWREELNRRFEGQAGPQRALREIQDQIFEVREEVKVLMQRDDRHERTLQELQADLNAARGAHA